ncbi:hypothetical protein FCULG_00002647 [Fusarium culmorum]|uniref:Uncharacterized protein n=1 Tax=Fusarium culmorum TaxID=5516 RepID=A0A2T4GNG6_FUSCU|nr:hypothetical protein FCULG_00002647 [Fusarium culmorum]
MASSEEQYASRETFLVHAFNSDLVVHDSYGASIAGPPLECLAMGTAMAIYASWEDPEGQVVVRDIVDGATDDKSTFLFTGGSWETHD